MFNDSVFVNFQTHGLKAADNKRVLAFIGPRKSGKTSAANAVTVLDKRFKKRSFADPVRQMYSEVYNVPMEDLVHNTKKEQYRAGLQEISWKVKKDRGMFYFAEQFFNNLEDKGELSVCDDLRFLEELMLLALFGGIAYKIFAHDKDRKRRGWNYDPELDEDMSETDIAKLSGSALYYCTGGGTIYNTKDERYLEEQILPILLKQFPENPFPEKPMVGDNSLDWDKLMSLEM